VDAVVAIYIPVLPTEAPATAAAIREGALKSNGKTILATFMSSAGLPEPLAPVPSFAFPERAVNALAMVTRYAEWRARPVGQIVKQHLDVAQLRAIVDEACSGEGRWLDPLEVSGVLRAAGIGAPATIFAHTASEASDAAAGVGFPVALKAYGPSLLHKSDVGGVKLNLAHEYAVVTAFEAMAASLGEAMTGVLVQPMVTGGVEMMLGATWQPSFGHVIACGAGGTLVELLGDVAFGILPLTDRDAREMVEGLRVSRLLNGYRGEAPADVAALEDAILRLSALLEVCPEIREIDLNPLKVMPHGLSAVDARIRVEAVVMKASRRIAY
jgi:acyl-CoA synthetase (NDP forming)